MLDKKQHVILICLIYLYVITVVEVFLMGINQSEHRILFWKKSGKAQKKIQIPKNRTKRENFGGFFIPLEGKNKEEKLWKNKEKKRKVCRNWEKGDKKG